MEDVDAQLPDHVEVEKLVVGYSDIFPFGGQIVLQDGTFAVVAFDQYCVRPGYRRTGVSLD